MVLRNVRNGCQAQIRRQEDQPFTVSDSWQDKRIGGGGSDAHTVFATSPVRKSLSIFSGTHSSPLLSIRLATRSQSGPAHISPSKAPTNPDRKQSPTCAVLKPKRLVIPKFRAKPAVLHISVIMHTDAQKDGKTTAGYANMAKGRRNVCSHVSPVGFVGVRNPNRR